jgi:hypothetical protein
VENVIYTVIPDGELLKCVDTSNGAILGSINIVGDIVSGPIVTGDRCTVIINNYMGVQGKVFKLPSFNVVTTFSA